MTFHIPNAGVLHGLAGYFEAVLYRNVGLSIHPEGMDQISPGMLSWFPLFFPFRVKSGSLREHPPLTTMSRTLSIFQAIRNYRFLYGESRENLKSGMSGTPSRIYQFSVRRHPFDRSPLPQQNLARTLTPRQ